MWALATPEFEILYDNGRFDRAGFDKRHRDEEKRVGPARTRPKRFLSELSDFTIDVSGDIALVSFKEFVPEARDPSRARHLFWVVLRRAGVDKEWLVNKMFTVPEAPGTAAAPSVHDVSK
jgi:hypothetical protein